MRLPAAYSLLIIILFYGCATIIHGTSQDVPIEMPKDTKVTSADGQAIPLMYRVMQGDTATYLRLERDGYYLLRFSYQDQQVTTALESTFDAGWLILDYFTLYGLIVDAITGAWHSFDGIAVHFPDDSSSPYVEGLQPKNPKNIGVVLVVSTGLALPLGSGESEFTVFNFFTLGLGYELSPKLTLLAEFNKGGPINIMPRYSDYRTDGSFSAYSIGGRLKIENTIYLSGGGGMTHITSTDLKYYDRYKPSLSYPPVDKTIGALYAGIGISGKFGFMELRHSLGLSKIPLSNGEFGTYETTALGFGLNLHF
jgi:hypothetical protein